MRKPIRIFLIVLAILIPVVGVIFLIIGLWAGFALRHNIVSEIDTRMDARQWGNEYIEVSNSLNYERDTIPGSDKRSHE